MSKRKRKFSTWADAEFAHDAAQRSTGILEIALRELVHGNVKWLSGDLNVRRVGLCKMDGAHGGVVIISDRNRVEAYYLEEWVNRMLTMPAPLSKKEYMPDYRAWTDFRALASRVMNEQRVANERLSGGDGLCKSTPLPAIVDQGVRHYG
jgi:hypothetical protein